MGKIAFYCKPKKIYLAKKASCEMRDESIKVRTVPLKAGPMVSVLLITATIIKQIVLQRSGASKKRRLFKFT